jgi:NAD(P)-dependent dehydrogenase (short-subunit alcohol dehydrogenase family)
MSQREDVVLVTGGGRGIGRAIALAFAEKKRPVALFSRSRGELEAVVRTIENAGGLASAVVGDVTDQASVHAAVNTIEARFGPISVLVNNAGVGGPIGPVAQGDPEDWWRAVEVNLRGPIITTHAILPGMLTRRRGTIINVVAGMAPFAYFSAYSAGKSALVRFSECLSAETKGQGVAVFPMGPGTVRTALSQHSLESEEGKRWLPWFKRVFDEGLDLPVEAPAQLAVKLASGRYDALSGLTINPRDDLDLMLTRLDEIQRDRLYSLRLRALPDAVQEKLAAIRDEGGRGRG